MPPPASIDLASFASHSRRGSKAYTSKTANIKPARLWRAYHILSLYVRQGEHHLKISLHYNGLNGQIPLQFGDLDSVDYLDLTGIDGDNLDLSALSDLPNLRYLSLGANGISDLSALTEPVAE